MYRLHVYHRHCSRAGQVTNEPQGDDTFEVSGSVEDLRRYAETGLADLEFLNTPDAAAYSRVYRNILEVLEGDMTPYVEFYGMLIGPRGEINDRDFPLLSARLRRVRAEHAIA